MTLPDSVRVAGFQFVPVRNFGELGLHLPESLIGSAKRAIQTHVDRNSNPVESFTLVLRVRSEPRWRITEEQFSKVLYASEVLAVSCLSEQRFLLGHFAPHLNATIFRPVSMAINSENDAVSTTTRRRGQALRVGGLCFQSIKFQCPPQVEHTGCEEVNIGLARAIHRASRLKDPLSKRLGMSIPLFLLANAEDQTLQDAQCLVLSAVAFERLLAPSQSKSLTLACAFDDALKDRSTKKLASSPKVVLDHDPKFSTEQGSWSIAKKWIKELYEVRSAEVHRGQNKQLSSNWSYRQHMVISAFAFPLVAKKLLQSAGHYELQKLDEVRLDVLDDLLLSDWGDGRFKEPEWPSIISDEQVSREIRQAIFRALK